ncbi:hypothetical protein GW860_08655 [bacterium]|nr:hypothetical protein [bacterium]NCP08953.1 hypothetical protein [bacterium]
MKNFFIWLVSSMVFMISYTGAVYSSIPVTVNTDPDVVKIGTLFNGTQISVSGTIPEDSEVIVQLTGKREDLELKQKGRILGVLWMNLGSVTFRQVPTLYMLYYPEAVGKFARSNPVKWQQLGIGLESLKEQIEITPDKGDKDKLGGEFLKLREGEELYAMREAPVIYGKNGNGMRSFATEVFIPARVPSGTYQVKVLAVNNGNIAGAATREIRVEKVGATALLSSLSFNHGGLYGLLAVLIAIAAGLLMDFLFGENKGAH